MNISRSPGEKLFQLGSEGVMELECPITDAERAALNAQVANISAETFRVEEEKRAAVQPLNEKLKDLKARERDALGQLAKGTVQREVRTRRVGDFFKGECWVERLDGEEPEEVPETRRALTAAERQTVMPGVVVDGRPNAPVLDLFSKPEGTAESTPMDGPRVTWTGRLASPFTEWRLEETTEGSTRHYMLTNEARAFGPFEWTDSFSVPGKTDGIPDDVHASIVAMFGEDAENAEEPGSMTNRFLVAAEDAAEERAFDLSAEEPATPSPSASAEAPADGPRVGTVYRMNGHPGWALYVHEGRAYFRLPNVDSFEPAGSPSDVGPFAWNPTEKMLDAVPGSAVTDEWMKQHARLLEEADHLVQQGKVKEPLHPLAASSTPTTPAPESPQPEGSTTEPANSPEAAAPSAEAVDGWALTFGEWRREEEDDAEPTLLEVKLAKGDLVGAVTWDSESRTLRVYDPTSPVPDDTLDNLQASIHLGTITLPAKASAPESSGPFDAASVAKKLSLPARMAVKVLAASPGLDTATIGNRARCRAGSVLNGLEEKGLVSCVDALWSLTAEGEAVARVLLSNPT